MNLVKEFMKEDLASCTPLTRLEEVERLMHEQNCSELSVINSLYEKRLVGIITDEDIQSRARIEGVDLKFLNVEQCMTMLPIAVSEETSLEDCLHLMDINHISRMPVVNKNGYYSGVINRNDIY